MALPGPRRVAPYERFAGGETSAQGEFASPEHFNHGRVEAASVRRNPKQKVILSDDLLFWVLLPLVAPPFGNCTSALQADLMR